MEDRDVIRALETINARYMELHASKEYVAAAQREKLKRLLRTSLRRTVRELSSYLKYLRIPRHQHLPNLSPEVWEESLRTGDANKRVVVYSCITGDYDQPLSPLWLSDNITYVLYRDQEHAEQVPGWEVRPIPEEIAKACDWSNTNMNRYIKFHPYELFADDFDVAVYIDGNIQPVSDLSYYADIIEPSAGIALHYHRERDSIAEEVQVCKAVNKGDGAMMDRQLERYVSEGFPLDYGLLECNVIAADLHSALGRDIFSDWWDEYCASGSMRDQIALPYVLWKHGVRVEEAATMGKNAYADTKIHIALHSQ